MPLGWLSFQRIFLSKNKISAIVINMDIIKLKQFLTNAKKNTYASGNKNKAKVSSNGTKEYIFDEGDLKYIDRYKGYEKFDGKENVFENNKVIWEMKYKGEILSNKILADNIYSFLKKALKQIPNNKPFRGPNCLIDKEYKYTNDVKGDVGQFFGKEKILIEYLNLKIVTSASFPDKYKPKQYLKIISWIGLGAMIALSVVYVWTKF